MRYPDARSSTRTQLQALGAHAPTLAGPDRPVGTRAERAGGDRGILGEASLATMRAPIAAARQHEAQTVNATRVLLHCEVGDRLR